MDATEDQAVNDEAVGIMYYRLTYFIVALWLQPLL